MRSEDVSIVIGKEFDEKIDPVAFPVIEFEIRIDELPPGTNVTEKGNEDAAFRLFVLFDEGKGWFTPPHTIGYVWDSTMKVGETGHAPRFSKVKYITIGSGTDGIGEWHIFKRNIIDDYKLLFGANEAPPIVAIALKCDSNHSDKTSASAIRYIELHGVEAGDSFPSPAAGVTAFSRNESPATEWTPDMIHQRLKTLNQYYTGGALFDIRDGQPVVMQLSGCGVTDLSPLEGMRIEKLDLRGLPVSDLDPLRGMPLVELYLEDTGVQSIEPLRGMKLERLYLSNTLVTDLSPLAGMPLTNLNLLGTAVTDLKPLSGAPLQYLWLNETPVSDISPLAKCPLVSLTLHRTRVADLRPLAGTALQRLHIGETPVTDLTPLTGMRLTRLVFTPSNISKGIEIARGMQSINEIGTTFESKMNPAQFWQLYDAGAFEE
jgi:Leucine-rich repeat (LRR) protein